MSWFTYLTEIWYFTPSQGACTACSSRPSFSIKKPSRPHPNCKCTIKSGYLAQVEVVSVTEKLVNTSQSEGRVALVTPKDCQKVTVIVSGSYEGGWEIGSGGFSISGKSSKSTSVKVEYNACHGGNCEQTEEIYAIYEVKEYQITTTYYGEDRSKQTLVSYSWEELSTRYDYVEIDKGWRCHSI